MDFKEFEKEVAGKNMIRYAFYKDGRMQEKEFIKSNPNCNSYSVSKAFTALAVGLLYDRKQITPENFVTDFLPLPPGADEKWQQVQIKHLLTHSTGLNEGCLFEADRYRHATDDFLCYALSQPLSDQPGEKITYSNSNTYILSCITEKITGEPLDQFLSRELHLQNFAAERCPMGHTMGATGMYLSTRDFLNLGILLLENDGSVVSREWVNLATSVQMQDGDQRSGYGLWVYDGGFLAGGAYGQKMKVNTKEKYVFACHSFAEEPIDSIIHKYF